MLNFALTRIVRFASGLQFVRDPRGGFKCMIDY